MKILVKVFLLVTFYCYTLQESIFETNSKKVNDFYGSLINFTENIKNEFKKLKDQITNIVTARDKRHSLNFDPILLANGVLITNNIGFRSGLQSSPNAHVIDRISNAALGISQRIGTPFDSLQRISSLQTPPELCPFKRVPECDPNIRYRSLDGSCNNLQNRWWGKSEIPYKRYIAAEYSDGFQQPRMFSKSRRPLPNSRFISRSLCVNNNLSEVFYSHILATFGQFLAHDMTSVSISTG